MKNLRLSEDTAGLYVRKYDYFPTTPKNTYVEIYAECYPASEEVKKTTGHELKLDIYFSIDQYSYRELSVRSSVHNPFSFFKNLLLISTKRSDIIKFTKPPGVGE